MNAAIDLNRLVTVAPAEFERVFGPAHAGANCVPQTYVGSEVLRYFGIDSQLWPCELLAQYRDLIVILGQGAAQEPDRVTYSGHLVLVVPSLPGMLDLSLGQLRRKFGVPVPDAAWFAWPREGIPAQTEVVYQIGDVELAYRTHPDPRAYRRHDFSEGRFRKIAAPMIGNIIRRLRGESARHHLGVRIQYDFVSQVLAQRGVDRNGGTK